jgi:hypothetical protein
MRSRDAKDQFTTSRAAHLARSTESNGGNDLNHCDSSQGSCEQPSPSVTPASRLYPTISTERIMQAVEQQRRVSQQLEDLRAQQKQRTAILRTTGLKFLAALCGACGVLAVAFVILLIVRPDLLARTLDALSGGIAALLMAEEEIKLGLSLIPSSSWLLSGAALVIVLMMGLWVRLMRYPQEV